jgi:hypothetical protein
MASWSRSARRWRAPSRVRSFSSRPVDASWINASNFCSSSSKARRMLHAFRWLMRRSTKFTAASVAELALFAASRYSAPHGSQGWAVKGRTEIETKRPRLRRGFCFFDTMITPPGRRPPGLPAPPCGASGYTPRDCFQRRGLSYLFICISSDLSGVGELRRDACTLRCARCPIHRRSGGPRSRIATWLYDFLIPRLRTGREAAPPPSASPSPLGGRTSSRRCWRRSTRPGS